MAISNAKKYFLYDMACAYVTKQSRTAEMNNLMATEFIKEKIQNEKMYWQDLIELSHQMQKYRRWRMADISAGL
jgi:hypothetical protein